MAARKQDINDFRARLKNIENPRNKAYFDPNLGMEIPKKAKRPEGAKANLEDSIYSVIIVSIFLTVVAMVFAEAVRVQYLGILGIGTTALVADLLIGIWALLIITLWLDKRWKIERFAQLIGLVAMGIGSHNLIWRWPDQMAYIYGDAHVAEITQNTVKYGLDFASLGLSF